MLFAMILNIDVRDTMDDVVCSVYVQVVWLVGHIMWVHNVHNSHFGGCLKGGIIHKKDPESPPRKVGELIAVSCQSALIRRIKGLQHIR